MALLIGVSTFLLIALGQSGDVGVGAITIGAVMVIAALGPHDPWKQPLIGAVGTAVGIAIGVAASWFANVKLVNRLVASQASRKREDFVTAGSAMAPSLRSLPRMSSAGPASLVWAPAFCRRPRRRRHYRRRPPVAPPKQSASKQSQACRRAASPAQVATLVALLASPRTGNVTGSNYVIDGGLLKDDVSARPRM